MCVCVCGIPHISYLIKDFLECPIFFSMFTNKFNPVNSYFYFTYKGCLCLIIIIFT